MGVGGKFPGDPSRTPSVEILRASSSDAIRMTTRFFASRPALRNAVRSRWCTAKSGCATDILPEPARRRSSLGTSSMPPATWLLLASGIFVGIVGAAERGVGLLVVRIGLLVGLLIVVVQAVEGLDSAVKQIPAY